LVEGDKIRVIKDFKDFDGEDVLLGSEWTFKEYTYFAYDGGFTFCFEEGVMRMAEISPEDNYVLTHAREYFILITN